MPKRSAGLLIYRRRGATLEVLLVHPGGPFWARRDAGASSIVKGEYQDGDDPLASARREAREELGIRANAPLERLAPGAFLPLGEVQQKSRKIVTAFAVACDIDADVVVSNTIALAWPPRSGRILTVPEIDRAAWFDLEEAERRINPAQSVLLDRLAGLPGV